ncbi:MAG: GatB/YqeY domain-containing protein [Candidatus Berkelbacteria bacterium]
MSLKETIESDYLSAYKSKNEQTISTLRMVRSAYKNFEINERKEATDEDIIRILKKEAKQRQDSITEFEKAGRADLVSKEKADLDIISEYLPKMISADEVEKIVDAVVADLGATSINDMGKVMAETIKRTAGAADNAQISTLVRQKLVK